MYGVHTIVSRNDSAHLAVVDQEVCELADDHGRGGYAIERVLALSRSEANSSSTSLGGLVVKPASARITYDAHIIWSKCTTAPNHHAVITVVECTVAFAFAVTSK